MSKLLIVESPAKSKTIGKYVGDEYTVMASIGHVRDLVQADGSVDVDRDFAMKWENLKDNRGQDKTKPIVTAAKKVDEIYLATDPDREGEAISWHISDILSDAGVKKPMKRVIFHEITKNAVQAAMKEPRDLDDHLVSAYLARRALDYLVGFKLSPVLWRKLPGSKSAGRVQSVALRLIADREKEIELFRAREYWTIEGVFEAGGKPFNAKLFSINGKKLEQFDIPSRDEADKIFASIGREFSVTDVEQKKQKRYPKPPFTTSTLQQEASRKLGMSAKAAMQTAQKLYEAGHITYMRTDAVNLSRDAVEAIRQMIGSQFGDSYLPGKPVSYDNKSKNAQEAHEAIRPTGFDRSLSSMQGELDAQQFKLYELIWKRAVACQMSPAEVAMTAVDLVDASKNLFRANGSMITFDGYMKLYTESVDDKEKDDEQKMLPPMATGDEAAAKEIKPEQHFTIPPPRFTEASLVKRMEELGIGRPSTYASILSVIQDRGYVSLEKKRFIPSDRGRIVSAFLTAYFTKYVENDFTAFMEDQLDEISNGGKDYKAVLHEFWSGFSAFVGAAGDLAQEDVIRTIDEDLGAHFFPEGDEARKCPDCGGRVSLRLGKFGGFIGCEKYPGCKYTKPLASLETDEKTGEMKPVSNDALVLGEKDGEKIYLRKGPYGHYVQLGENSKEAKRASLPRGVLPDDMTLDKALFLLSLPLDIGAGVMLANGKFGAYISREGVNRSLPAGADIFTFSHEEAEKLLAGAPARAVGKELGRHPDDGKPVVFHKTGRYGPYVAWNRVFASVYASEGINEDNATLDWAVEKLAKKRASKK